MIRVLKVADIIGNRGMGSPHEVAAFGEVAGILGNVDVADDPIEADPWKLILDIGDKTVTLDIPQLINKSDDLNSPILFWRKQPERATCIAYYRNCLFHLHRAPATLAEKDEVLLRIKKILYDEAAEISALRATVANLEAAIEYQKTGPIRDPISDEVKILVWARDGGSCRRCDARINLQFDHIIPVAKGGGNSAESIQILCQPCNLRKSDRIAMP